MKLLTTAPGAAARPAVGVNTNQRRAKTLEKFVRTMKITALLLTVACLHVAAGSYSQQVTLSLKNAPIEKVFREIERQTGYGFLYNKKMFENFPNVTIVVKNADVKDVLNRCFHSSTVEYVMNDQTIIIREKTAAEKAVPPGEVHGRVVDNGGAPLEGVNVVVKGTTKGVVTGTNGEFLLKGVGQDAVLVVSSVGYQTQEVKVGGNGEIRIGLSQSMSKLDETVVKGYYNTSNRLNTGDVTTVKGEDIAKQPVQDPILALEGRVPGLYIQQTSGAPGAYSTIRIEGQNSIFNGNDPLYIIDGVPYSATSLTSPDFGGGMLGTPLLNGTNQTGYASGMSPFNLLNPADIENIEILKDADATAIYGSRGANGVILITTKKGKTGNTRVDANVFSGSGKVTRKIQLLNTEQYLTMRHEAFANDGAAPNPKKDYDLIGWDTTSYTDWQKILIGNNATFTNAQLSLSGGTANTQFVAGGGYSNQGTVYPGSYSDQKAMANFNLTHSSNDNRFHLQMSVNYVNDISNLPTAELTKQITLAPDAPAIYNTNGTLNWQPVNGTASTWTNPLAYTMDHANAKSYNLISNLTLNYEILRGLHLKANFGFNQEEMDQSVITPATQFAPPTANNNPNNRRNLIATTEGKSWITEPQITYDRKISKGNLSILVGTTFQENLRNSISTLTSGFSSDALINNPALASTVILLGSEYNKYHYEALFARISYDWDGKYVVNLTGRRDGSSRFGPGKQFGDFGAIGAGWIFSKEQLINDNLSFLSFGKLRASYGVTGNDQIGDYQYLSTYASNSSTFQNLTGLAPTNLTNPYFAWEQVKKIEAAIELGFLKDRILISGSYFINKSNNQLIGYTLPYVTGFSFVEQNLPASVQNTGVELTLNSINVRSKHFTWTSIINATLPSNKLLAFPNLASSSYNATYAVGKSLFINYFFHNTGVNPQTGVYSFTTKNANGAPSAPSDYIVSKPVTQTLFGGIENSFTYKGFRLDVLFQVVKQLGFDYFRSFGVPGPFNRNEPVYVLSRWKNPGDLTDIQRFATNTNASANTAYSNLVYSDAAIIDASFVRLKNLAISYEFPSQWRSKAKLQIAKIYIQCQNLLTITEYKGLDPETGGLNLPPLRMLTGGIQIAL